LRAHAIFLKQPRFQLIRQTIPHPRRIFPFRLKFHSLLDLAGTASRTGLSVFLALFPSCARLTFLESRPFFSLSSPVRNILSAHSDHDGKPPFFPTDATGHSFFSTAPARDVYHRTAGFFLLSPVVPLPFLTGIEFWQAAVLTRRFPRVLSLFPLCWRDALLFVWIKPGAGVSSSITLSFSTYLTGLRMMTAALFAAPPPRGPFLVLWRLAGCRSPSPFEVRKFS